MSRQPRKMPLPGPLQTVQLPALDGVQIPRTLQQRPACALGGPGRVAVLTLLRAEHLGAAYLVNASFASLWTWKRTKTFVACGARSSTTWLNFALRSSVMCVGSVVLSGHRDEGRIRSREVELAF